MKRNGFTLIELLVVIVILAALLVFAISTVGGIMNSSRNNIYEKNRKSLRNSAEQLVLDVEDFYSDIYNCKKNTWIGDKCEMGDNTWKKITITVKDLKENNYFTDTQNACDSNATIIIENKGNKAEYNIPEDVCVR